jgi:hypothetical protein
MKGDDGPTRGAGANLFLRFAFNPADGSSVSNSVQRALDFSRQLLIDPKFSSGKTEPP